MQKRHFDILNISPTKDRSEIKKAYRKLALKYHPDRNPSSVAAEKFIQITEAYEAILNGLDNTPNYSSTSQTNSQSKQYNTKDFNRSAFQPLSEEEILKERLRQAKIRHEYLKQREEALVNNYYEKINSGWRKKVYLTVTILATLTSLLFTLDKFVFPKHLEKDLVVENDPNQVFAGVIHDQVVNIITKNDYSLYIPQYEATVIYHRPKIYLEKTYFFKDIKAILYWDYNKWNQVRIDFSEINTYPVFPLLLLLPLLTLFFNKNTTLYFILHFISMYAIGSLLLIMLLFNHRWLSLFSLGYF